MDDDDYQSWLSAVLEDAYRQHLEKHEKSVYTAKLENNCTVMSAVESRELINSYLIDGIVEVGCKPGQEQVEILSFSAPDDFGYSEVGSFWSPIFDMLPAEITVKSRMILNLKAPKFPAGVCHDMLIFLFAFGERFSIDFYSRDSFSNDSYSMWACRNGICVSMYSDPFLNEQPTLATRDPALVRKYWSAGVEFLRGKEPVMQRNTFQALYHAKFFQSFLLDRTFYTLHTEMPALFINEPLLTSLRTRYDIPAQFTEMYDFYHKTLSDWTAIVYKSSVINFFFNGRLSLFGRTVELTADERKQFLDHLLEMLDSTQGSLVILNDTNPVLNRDETACAVYLTDRSMFALSAQEQSRQIFSSGQSDLVQCFHQFFREIQRLDDSFVIKNDAAKEFLKNGFRLM